MKCNWFASGRKRQQEKMTPPPSSPSPVPPDGVRILRVTDESDGELLNRGYSYWPQALVVGMVVYVFVGHADGSPRFFMVNKTSGEVKRLGSIVPYSGTGEGWYWGSEGSVYLCEGPRLRSVNPFSGSYHVVFDISETHPGCRLWQAHSSDDGLTHSATVQRIVEEGAYPNVGTVIYRNGIQVFYPAQGILDESQVTPDGNWLVIKEEDDNRIINLGTGEERWIRDREGAVGHSDVGPGILVGEDNIHGWCVKVDLQTLEAVVLFPTWNMGHLSIQGGRCLLSGPESLSLVPLSGGSPSHLLDHAMVGSGYDFQVQANLDHTGRVAYYLTNHGTDRLDAFLAILE